MSRHIEPLADRVLVRRVEIAEKTEGGLFIPKNAVEKPMEGVVVAVGPGRLLDSGAFYNTTLVVGDKVLFQKYAGTNVEMDGGEHLIMREDDILGRIMETA